VGIDPEGSGHPEEGKARAFAEASGPAFCAHRGSRDEWIVRRAALVWGLDVMRRRYKLDDGQEAPSKGSAEPPQGEEARAFVKEFLGSDHESFCRS
jgi:hypothetical protein